MSAAQVIDWSKVEPHYRAGLRSLPDLAKEFGVSHTAIAKHAKKSGWDRSLKAKVQARADTKVSDAMVSASDKVAGQRVTETLRVEVEAEVQARIRLSHRGDINRFRDHAMHLLTQLDQAGEETNLLTRTKVLKDLTDVTKTLIGLEREAYGLEGPPPAASTPENTDPTDVARRLAFLLAAGIQHESRTLQ